MHTVAGRQAESTVGTGPQAESTVGTGPQAEPTGRKAELTVELWFVKEARTSARDQRSLRFHRLHSISFAECTRCLCRPGMMYPHQSSKPPSFFENVSQGTLQNVRTFSLNLRPCTVQAGGFQDIAEAQELRDNDRRTHAPSFAPAAAPVSPEATVAAASMAEPKAAPMVVYVTVHSSVAGTFYRAPAPGKPAFVQVGDKVTKGQPLCIIEDMKLANTVECDADGTVVAIIVRDGCPVSTAVPLLVIGLQVDA